MPNTNKRRLRRRDEAEKRKGKNRREVNKKVDGWRMKWEGEREYKGDTDERRRMCQCDWMGALGMWECYMPTVVMSELSKTS